MKSAPSVAKSAPSVEAQKTVPEDGYLAAVAVAWCLVEDGHHADAKMFRLEV